MSTAHILTVCTGNVCRSPFTERVLTTELRAASIGEAEVAVSSAGTHALVGDPMTPPMQGLVTQYGGHHDGFVSRLLQAEMVERADLVLALTRKHRGAVARLHPRASRYTFTLRELARLADLAEPTLDLPDAPASERLRALVPQLAAQRGMAPLQDPLEDDVTDPYGRTAEFYERSVQEMLPGIDALVAALADRSD